MERRRLSGIKQEPTDLVNITLNPSNIGVLILIVDGREYPYIEGATNVHSVSRGKTVTFRIDANNTIIDYFEFSDNTSGSTLHVGNDWNLKVEEAINIKGYAGISNVNYYDSAPEGFETYLEWYNQLPFGMPIRKLTLIRSFKAAAWSTICLPFSTNTRGTAIDGLIYEMNTGASTPDYSTFNVDFIQTNNMIAGMPYMYLSRIAVTNPFFEYIVLDRNAVAGQYNAAGGNVYFVGSLNTTTHLAAGDKTVRYMSNNRLYCPSQLGSGVDMTPDRGYFKAII